MRNHFWVDFLHGHHQIPQKSHLFPINMYRLATIFLVSVYTFILNIFQSISKYAHRLNREGNGSNFSENHSQKDHPENFMGLISSGLSEKENLELQKIVDSTEETGDSVFLSKYEFTSGENVSEYLQEPIAFKFTIHEMFVGLNNFENSPIKYSLELEEEKNSEEFDSCSSTNGEKIQELENIAEEEVDNPLENFCVEEINEGDDELNKFSIEGIDSMEDLILEDQDFSYEVELLPEVLTQENESNEEKGADFLESKKHEEEEIEFDHSKIFQRLEDLEDEYIEFELLSSNSNDINKEELRNRPWGTDSDDDEEDEEDVLSEHQNLVQQMKMELKNCRIGGLPTISEECETPQSVDDLKPLKIDQKFEYKDVIEEIQKFYKSYAEKMRKLDILNYQTLHAISFLQLKDSEVFTAGKKKSNSAPFNLLKIWPSKVRRIYSDSTQKSIIEMHRDLELVYVGQLCLSWEILSWIYIKAKELMEYDSKEHHSYNRVAEEFQQFQVLLQRFVEDEPFQGPRIQNYVKNRCAIRSLLQVPLIKDDCMKDKKERREESDTISLELLVEIIWESMLIFRDFLRSDKEAGNVVLKGIHGTKVDLQESENPELLVDIIANLQKKDRRIREHMRSQNCIVKKFQKHQECGLDQELFTSQVELRLVSRVLCMPRLTIDQLIWCQNKLSNINFVRRRIQRESSLLLFPC